MSKLITPVELVSITSENRFCWKAISAPLSKERASINVAFNPQGFFFIIDHFPSASSITNDSYYASNFFQRGEGTIYIKLVVVMWRGVPVNLNRNPFGGVVRNEFSGNHILNRMSID